MATCLTPGTFGRCQASNLDPIHLVIFSKFKCNHFSIVKQNSITTLRVQNDSRRNLDVAVYSSAKPEPPIPADPSPGSCTSGRKARILGMIMRIVLPFCKGKLGTLLRLNEKFETTLDTAEHVADMVEEVAEGVEKVAEGAVNHLPKGKLHDAAESAEKLAEKIDKNFHLAEKALQKVEEVEKEMKSFIQSTSHQKNNETTAAREEKDQK